MVRSAIFSVLFLFSSQIIIASSDAYVFAVYFKDKAHNQYSLSLPQEFLSQKCLERRARQNIGFYESDLPVSKLYSDSLLSFDVRFIHASKWLNCAMISSDEPEVFDEISKLGFVEKVVKVSAPTAILKKQQSKFEALNELSADEFVANEYYGLSTNQNTMIRVDFLHARGFKGDSVDVAVFDSGFNNAMGIPGFDSLFLGGRFLGSLDMKDNDENVFNDGSHGTACLSCMAANEPGRMVGTAPNANYALFRTEVGESETIEEEYFWAFAAEFAESGGAEVFSTSLGYTTFDDTSTNHTYADLDGNTTVITRASNIAARLGIVVLNSAGNYGASAWRYIGAPADADSILAVGAVNENGIYASFSSRGPNSSGRIKPDVCARGVGTAVYNTNGEVYGANGTSFSCPVLAGGAACLRQAFPSVHSMELMQAIRESAHKFKSPTDTIGYGIPDLAVAYMLLFNSQEHHHHHDNLLSDVDVFPNPFSNLVNVYLGKPLEEKIKVSIFDFNGKLVQEEEMFFQNNDKQLISVNTSNLSNGVYLLKLQGKSFYDVKRIVRQ
jgi:serine protease AprX